MESIYIQCGTVSSILRGTFRALWRLNQMRHAKKLGCWCLRAIILFRFYSLLKGLETQKYGSHPAMNQLGWCHGFEDCSIFVPAKWPDIARPKRKDKVSFTKWHLPTWWLASLPALPRWVCWALRVAKGTVPWHKVNKWFVLQSFNMVHDRLFLELGVFLCRFTTT